MGGASPAANGAHLIFGTMTNVCQVVLSSRQQIALTYMPVHDAHRDKTATPTFQYLTGCGF